MISGLHIIFSLCLKVGWCDVCTDFTNVIKVDVDVNEMGLFKKQLTELKSVLGSAHVTFDV